MLMDKPRRGFRCECWTQDVNEETGWPALRASFDAYSAPQADRWVAVALSTISPTLDPDASDEAWAWLYGGRIENPASPLTPRTLHSLSHPRQHPRHLEHPAGGLPTVVPSARTRTPPPVRLRLQVPACHLVG
ncbi:hypothetical protein GCM10010270_40900 [Streptomyces violaceus]|nr:hypothetical protein GCM10010270_40900 [Streptomyces janthinus]